jgi:tetratricopeptide (TPR) repeat protein
MGRLIVQFPGDAGVLLDGAPAGRTNRVLPLAAGDHVVRLADDAGDPPERKVTLAADAPAAEVVWVSFAARAEPLDRFSPLYCAYNGFLLGQFLSLAFRAGGDGKYAIRRARMAEFLAEIGVSVPLPESAPGLGEDALVALYGALLPEIAARSRPLVDFVLFGGLLTHYGVVAASDPGTARTLLDELTAMRGRMALPPFEPSELVFRDGSTDPDDVLSPALAYLARVVAALEVEPRTAFVIMPFRPPFDSYFASFYRPALEGAGYRAFRAWGGLASEDYADLLIALIRKSGAVWADVSGNNDNVLYEIGAAHALGKISMLVVRASDAGATPANIGHDAVVRYDDRAADWPGGMVRLSSALLASLTVAAERGERLRVTPDAVRAVVEDVGRRLRAVLTPPEAEAARAAGVERFAARDYAGAAARFDEAVALGLDDAATLLQRGFARVGAGLFAEAEADFGPALADGSGVADALRASGAYFRGMARDQQDDLAGAIADYDLAVALGYPGVEPVVRRGRVRLAQGDRAGARADAETARAVAPDDADLAQLDAELAG